MSDDKRKKESDKLVELLDPFKVCNFQSRPYMINGNRAFLIGAKESRDFASYLFYTVYRKAPTRYSIDEAFAALRGRAIHEAESVEIFKRVAALNGRRYLDLADKAGTIIEVDAEGWRVVKNPPVIFARPDGMKSLPMPENPGNVSDIRNFINVKTEEDFKLLICWCVSCLNGRPGGRGSYAALYVNGTAGAAKTSACKVIVYIIDPSTPETRTPPKEVRDLFIAGGKRHIISFDNISGLDGDLQDACSSIITGGGFARKENYSDLDETIFESCNPLIFNGIEFRRKPDFADRCIDLSLDKIEPESRLTEFDLWAAVDAARPRILGGLLTLLSGALRELEHVEKQPLPRLADFGKLSIAVERAAGWEAGSALAALNDNQTASARDLAEGTPILKRIVSAIDAAGGIFEGTASTLYAKLSADGLADFPKNPQRLSSIIQRNIGILKTLGVNVTRKRIQGERVYEMRTDRGGFDDELSQLF